MLRRSWPARPGWPRCRRATVVEPAVDLAMSHENSALVMNQFAEIFEGTGLEPTRLGPGEDRDHLRPPRPGGDGEDGHQPEEDPRVRGRAGDHQVPRRARRRGRHLPPDPGRERLRAARAWWWWAPTATPAATGPWERWPSAWARPTWPGVWALGRLVNVEVPATIKVVADGEFRPCVGPKDLILYLIGMISAEGANFRVIEFHGRADQAHVASRAGWCSATCRWRPAPPAASCRPTRRRSATCGRRPASTGPFTPVAPGRRRRLRRGRSRSTSPGWSRRWPGRTPWTTWCRSARSEGVKIDQIVIGSCTNGRLDDLEAAAAVLRGKKVAAGTRMLVFPASWRICTEAHAQRAT